MEFMRTVECCKIAERKYLHNFPIRELVFPATQTNIVTICNTSKQTKLRLYTLISGRFHRAYDITGEDCLCCLSQDESKVFLLNCKMFIVVTSVKCKLDIRANAFEYIKSEQPYAPLSWMDSINHSIARPLFVEDISGPLSIQGIAYKQYTSTLVTITSRRITGDEPITPYSVKIPWSAKTLVRYIIKTSPTEGDMATVKISCIETTSPNTYSFIRDKSNNKLSSNHNGCILDGSFLLPSGCLDVGFQLYTPLGFSCNIGEDDKTCMAKFELVELSPIL